MTTLLQSKRCHVRIVMTPVVVDLSFTGSCHSLVHSAFAETAVCKRCTSCFFELTCVYTYVCIMYMNVCTKGF